MSPLELTLTAAAFFTALLSGVAGLGGGTLLIGVMFAAGLSPVQAVPLFAAVQFVSNSARTVAYLRDVEWRAAGWFLLAAIPATVLLVPLAMQANAHVIGLALGLLILTSLLPMPVRMPALPARAAYLGAGALNGALGMFVGATGLFVGRLFLRPEWARGTVIGTLALTQSLAHLLRVIAYGAAGFAVLSQWRLLLPMCVAVMLGTAAGRALNTRVPEAVFARVFRLILATLSIKLLWDASRGLGWI